MSDREFAIAVVRRLREAGHQALWAGGCVRDELLGLQPDDFDVATDARPEQVARIFRRTVAVGASFGVVQVLGPHDSQQLTIEVATFRSDGAYIDGRRPEDVVFSSPEQDAQRRDFTINGIFFDPIENRLIDYVGGQADLQARLLRAIGDPVQRFHEDKLRLLRGVRLSARFGFEIEPATLAAIRAMADQIIVVSAERIADELRKMLALPERARALALFMDLGLAQPILPELMPLRDLRKAESADSAASCWEYVLKALSFLGCEISFPLALACLLHEVGKKDSGRNPSGSRETAASRLAGQICTRLKLSVAQRERVEWLVDRQRYLRESQSMPVSQLKRVLVNPGARELLALHRALALAEGRVTDHVNYCKNLLEKWSDDDLNPAVLVTGHDVAALGLRPGPNFKELLDIVRDAQLEGIVSTKEAALAMLEQEVTKRAGKAPE